MFLEGGRILAEGGAAPVVFLMLVEMSWVWLLGCVKMMEEIDILVGQVAMI